MISLIIRRLLQLFFVVWSVGTVTFALSRLLPGDAAFRIAASRYGYDNVNSAAADAVRAELGLERPVLEQYFGWLGDLARFNLGDSLVSGLPVTGELWHLLGHTLLLAFWALLMAALIAVPVGIYAAIKAEGWFDRLTLAASAFLRSQPVFVIGLMLILIFALELRLLPVAGYNGPQFIVLPALSLALTLAAVSNRVVRSSAFQVIHSTFFTFARVKGLSFRQAFGRHGVRNIALPVVVFMGIQFVTLIEGVMMIESLFSWPGIGHGLVHAVFGRDVPMIQGAALAMGAIFVGLNLLTDMACHLINPLGRYA